jgi:hypothetical protein
MGIAAAKVPSSSLDKITAEWLEEELIKDHPGRRRLAPRRWSNRPSPRPSRKKSFSSPRRRRPNRTQTGSQEEPAESELAPAGAVEAPKPSRRRRPPPKNRPDRNRRKSRVHPIANAPAAARPGDKPGRQAKLPPSRLVGGQRAGRDGRPAAKSEPPPSRPPAAPQPKISLPDDWRGHHHQAADRRARTGRGSSSKSRSRSSPI